MPNNFEIHVGFPLGDKNQIRKFLEVIKREKKGWSYSDVFSVDSDPRILDPHNVPGTLCCLVSKDYPASDSKSNDKLTKDMTFVLETLSNLGIQDARVELEFVFGYLNAKNEKNNLLELHSWNLPLVQTLAYDKGQRIKDTPNSEIHFVMTPNQLGNGESRKKLTTKEASEIIKSFNVDVQQTIEYRSQAMRTNDINDTKLICTSYYDTPEDAKIEANQLLKSRNIIRGVEALGYSLKLVAERIFACYKPIL